MPADPQRIQSIFLAALETADSADRADLLSRECGDDAELRQRIEVLLHAHDQSGSFLDKPAVQPITTDEPAGQWIDRDALLVLAERPGMRVGRYKLLQQIGEGGMGVVYMAEQEQPVRRKIALKIIKPGMDSAQVIALRGRAASSGHDDYPNIAKVLDGGATESGRPYFVMELVYGVPITKFCDDSQLTPRQRLELLVPICQAIQHAHQKCIIHRDIKPSNVLVTMHDDKPVPKVIDFGVAKAVEQRLTERSLFTAFGAAVGTYEYMSPEQAEMNAFGVDTRSDVYSLGVLLYELLTGTTPLERKRLREAAYTEMLRLIKELEPPRPSVRLSSSGDLPKIAAARRTEPRRLPYLLRGEIDWIVMRCLEKDRSRRYESASALARDVERYLRDEAVEACPPSLGYRLRKFSRKYRRVLSTLSAFAALLLIASGVSIWLARTAMRAESDADKKREATEEAQQKADDERNRADREAAQAKANAAETGRALDRMSVAKGIQLAEEGNLFAALPWLIKPLERGGLTPEEELVHRTRFACFMRHTPGRPTLRQILFHDGPVSHAAFSPDAKQVLVVSNKIVHVWDVRSGKSLVTIPHPAEVTAAQFTPDGLRVLTVADSAIWTWDSHSGGQLGPPLFDWGAFLQEPLAVLPQASLQFIGNIGAQELVNDRWTNAQSVVFSRDGRRILLANRRLLRLLDLESRKPIQQWVRGTESAWGNEFALGPDGRWVLLIKDGLARAHDTTTGKIVALSVPEDGPTKSVALSADGTHAVTIGKDGAARVWDAITWQPRTRLGALASRYCQFGAFSPDSHWIAFWGSWVGGIRNLSVWDSESGGLVREIPELNLDLQGFAWRPDSQQLIRISKKFDLTLWNAASQWISTGAIPNGNPVTVAVYGPDARTLLAATDDGTVRLWDLGQFTGVHEMVAQREAGFGSSIQISYVRDGMIFESFGTSESAFEIIRIMGTEKIAWPGLAQVKRLLPPNTSFTRAVFSPDKSRVVTTHAGPGGHPIAKSIQLWDAQSGQRTGKPIEVNASYVTFSRDNRWLLAACEDGVVRLLNARTGEMAGKPLVHGGEVFYATFSPDGEIVISCGDDRTACLWYTRTGQPLGDKLRHKREVNRAAFSPNGRVVATASLDGSVRLWDLERGTPMGTLECKTGSVWDMKFDPDGLMLLVSFTDGNLKIWEVGSGQDVSPPGGNFYPMPLPFTVERNKDRRILVGIPACEAFDITPDGRPFGDLVKLAELYSGSHLDVGGTAVALDQAQLQARWRELRSRYPEEFAVSTQEAIAWRIGQGDTAFHRRWLAAELAESGWQTGEHGNEKLKVSDYLQRLYTLAVYGRHAEAVSAADVLVARWPKDQDTLYNCACVRALAAGAVKGDAPLADRYAAGAVVLLQQAVAAGYKNGQHMLKDSDLDSLRKRDDFRMLLKKLNAKQP